MIFVKISRIIFKILILNVVFPNNIVFASYYLQSSELNETFDFFKKKLSFIDFLIGKIAGLPFIRAYTVIDF
jgi:hypothetical protein